MTTVDSFQQTVASGWIVIIDGVILSIIDGWKGRGERRTGEEQDECGEDRQS